MVIIVVKSSVLLILYRYDMWIGSYSWREEYLVAYVHELDIAVDAPRFLSFG